MFNGEATVIISGSYDATTRIWDVKSQSHHPIQILKEAKDDITSVRINQHEILTGSVDGHVRVYDLRMGRLIADNVGCKSSDEGDKGKQKKYKKGSHPLYIF